MHVPYIMCARADRWAKCFNVKTTCKQPLTDLNGALTKHENSIFGISFANV